MYRLVCHVNGYKEKPYYEYLDEPCISLSCYKSIMFHIIFVRSYEVKDEKTVAAIKDVLSKGPALGNASGFNRIFLSSEMWMMRNEQNIGAQNLFKAVQLIKGEAYE